MYTQVDKKTIDIQKQTKFSSVFYMVFGTQLLILSNVLYYVETTFQQSFRYNRTYALL